MTQQPPVWALQVFVRQLALEAEVGVYAHERGRKQPLVIDVELDIAFGGSARLADTFNYERVRSEAQRLASSAHFDLVEGFAESLCRSLMTDDRVLSVKVRVEKPLALAPDAAAAGVEMFVVRR